MFGKFISFGFLLSSVFLLACAKPNYAVERNLDPGTQAEEAHCTLQFSKSHWCLVWKWEKAPTESDVGSFVFKIYSHSESDGSMVLVDVTDTVEVLLWMPDMNHGSSPVEVSKLDMGTYRADEVFFIMPGKWQIKFQIKTAGVVTDEAITTLHF